MKELRIESGMNQLRLAEVMHVDKSLVSRVESGNIEPTADFVVSFATALGVDVRESLLKAGYLTSDQVIRGLGDAKVALEIIRLVSSIQDEDERDDAIADIRALLKARAARLEARKTKRGTRATADRGKSPGHA